MKPDFSGRWRFNPKRSALQIPPPVSAVFIVDHAEPLFRLSRTIAFADLSDTFSIDLTTDGREVVLVRDGWQISARMRWEGETLIFHSRLVKGDEEATNIVRYRFADSRDSFFAEERFRSRNLSYDNVWALEREEDNGTEQG